MDRLIELIQPSTPGNLQRRWFTSETMDLVIWQHATSDIQAFQLCYGKPLHEQAVEWRQGSGSTHFIVDDGSLGSMTHKATPVMKGHAPGIPPHLLQQFAEAARDLPSDISSFVLRHLQQAEKDT
jgi:hypothetical protein